MRDETLTPDGLAGFTGSGDYHAHWLRRFVFTDGVKFAADRGGACWLLDAIASHQTDPLAGTEPFQVWVLSRTTGGRAVLELNDGRGRGTAIVRQDIEFTDLPLATITFYLCDGVLMLPSEY